MNKLINIAALCLVTAGCSTLKLAMNQKAPDGNQLYQTSEVMLFANDYNAIYTTLGAKVAPTDTMYAITVTCNKTTEHTMFRKGNKIIVGFEDGTEFSLVNMWDLDFAVENKKIISNKPVNGVYYNYGFDPWVGYVPLVSNQFYGFVPTLGNEKSTTSYGLYLISTDQLMSVIRKKVTKFVLEAGESKMEMIYPENSSGVYAQLHEFLLECINKHK